jgi:hypothetical protein
MSSYDRVKDRFGFREDCRAIKNFYSWVQVRVRTGRRRRMSRGRAHRSSAATSRESAAGRYRLGSPAEG